jgi:hypothetical protein
MKREPDFYCNLYNINPSIHGVSQYTGKPVYTRETCDSLYFGARNAKRFAVLRVYIKDKTMLRVYIKDKTK